MTPTALTIAGSDPSGGAGLQADLKTFHQHQVYGMSVVTLITVQNTQTVARVELLESALVQAQLEAITQDIPPAVAKSGALGNAEVIELVAAWAATNKIPLIVDPVMISKHGCKLLDDVAGERLKARLVPEAFLLTPNRFEASELVGRPVEDLEAMKTAAQILRDCGARNVLVKGGQDEHNSDDVLLAGDQIHILPTTRIETRQTHGTGCVMSAAIAARLAKGDDVVTAVFGAKKFVTSAIRTAPGLGHGHGPVNMHAPID